MQFIETPLHGVFIVELEQRADERGFFARTWCAREFEEQGLETNLVHGNLSFNTTKGTLRGLHYQLAPHEEAKLVRCIKGALFDQIIDLRSDSPTYLRSHGVELSADNHRAFYVPPGFAHGFQTLEDNTEAFYLVSEFYSPAAERGIRHDDPKFQLTWPLSIASISEKDANWPDY